MTTKSVLSLSQVSSLISQEKQEKQYPPVRQAFGCRSPTSMGVGKWDGAFVFADSENARVMAIFEDNKDYIGYVNNEYQASSQYYNFIDQGWKPMTVDDLKRTAGLKDITKETNLSVPPRDSFEILFWNLFAQFQ